MLDGCRDGVPLRLRDVPPSVLRLLRLDPSLDEAVGLEWSTRVR